MINLYDIGDVARCSIEFKDLAGALVDPTTVAFKYREPGSANVTTYNYPSSPQLVKDSTGKYHVDLVVAAAGEYHYRWESTGAGQVAEEGEFHVQKTRLD